MADSDAGWVRPATDLERRFDAGHSCGCLVMSYCVRFSTTRQLTEEDLQRAVTCLYRTVPVLRLCLGYRHGKLWLREMPEERTDWKIVSGENPEEEYQRQLAQQYDTTRGPLWVVRLLPCSPLDQNTHYPESAQIFPRDQLQLIQDTFKEPIYGNCTMNTKKSSDDGKYPHQYNLMLGFNHANLDGYSCIKSIGIFMKYLNSILSGYTLDEQIQAATMINMDNELQMLDTLKNSFKENPKIFETKKNEYLNFKSNRPLLLDAYPVETETVGRTESIIHHFDEDATKDFVTRCKKEKVSFHTAFCSVAGCSAVDMLLKAGFTRHAYDIQSVHIVNHRKYNGNVGNSFGTCIGYVNATDNFPSDYLDAFWQNARDREAVLRERIRSGSSIETAALQCLLQPPDSDLTQSFLYPPTPHYYFYTNSMSDTTAVIGDCGKHMEVEWLHACTSNHRAGNLCVHGTHTLRGRIQYVLSYSTQYMTKSTARLLGQTVVRMIGRVARL